MVDELAVEYADRPVVFLEDDVDAPFGRRYDRWWAAYGSSASVYLPLVMASSGHRISNGPVDFRPVYGAMVDAELARPAQAEVEAWARRVGNAMRVYVRVVNLAPATLSASANAATVHALVWEDKRVHVTARTVRAASWAEVAAPVAPGASHTAVLTTASLAGVDWGKLHAVALVDYRPGGRTGPYDLLQAALAAPPDLAVTPAEVAATTAELAADGTLATVSLRGPHVLNWTAASSALWLTATPGAGAVPGSATLAVVRGLLPFGVSEGKVTFAASSADGLAFTREVTVRVDARRLGGRGRLHFLRPVL